MKIELGETYHDIHTGFAGTATARCEYLCSTARVLIEARAKEGDNEPQNMWFEEARLAPGTK